MIYTNHYASPLGRLLLAGDEEGLTGLWFMENSHYYAQGLQKDAAEREMEYFDRTKQWLDIYFTGKDPGFMPKIHLTGSQFRNRVVGTDGSLTGYGGGILRKKALLELEGVKV